MIGKSTGELLKCGFLGLWDNVFTSWTSFFYVLWSKRPAFLKGTWDIKLYKKTRLQLLGSHIPDGHLAGQTKHMWHPELWAMFPLVATCPGAASIDYKVLQTPQLKCRAGQCGTLWAEENIWRWELPNYPQSMDYNKPVFYPLGGKKNVIEKRMRQGQISRFEKASSGRTYPECSHWSCVPAGLWLAGLFPGTHSLHPHVMSHGSTGGRVSINGFLLLWDGLPKVFTLQSFPLSYFYELSKVCVYCSTAFSSPKVRSEGQKWSFSIR